VKVEKLTAAQARIRATHRPHALERLPRPLALTLRLDAARRALAARALAAGGEALGLGGVAAAAGFAVACFAFVCGHLTACHLQSPRTIVAG